MSEQSLPKEYEGYLTAELLELWASIPDRTLDDPPVSGEKVSAMHGLLYDYGITDLGTDGKNDPAKIRRSKQLLAPYGIDPAPWADENGFKQAHLSRAHCERIQSREQAKRERMRAASKG